MAYPERKPIYDAYESIVQRIIDSKPYKVYAENEIAELDTSLQEMFKQIRLKLLISKTWPHE